MAQNTSPEFQVSFSTYSSVLIHSVLQAHSPDTVPHIFATLIRNVLSISTVTVSTLSSTLAIRYSPNTVSAEECPILAVRWSYVALIAYLDTSTLSRQNWIPLKCSVLFLYGKVLAALTSWALRVFTLLSALALGYNIVFIFEWVSLKDLPRYWSIKVPADRECTKMT